MRFELHDTAKTYCHFSTNVAAFPRRKRFRFYHTILRTFDVLRMLPQYKRFVNSPDVKQTIAAEAHRWITSH